MTPVNEPIAQVEALSDGRLIVWDFSQARKLYMEGFYGKPLGIAKPREDFEAPLILDPIEGIYLHEKGLINIYTADAERIELKEIRVKVASNLEGFDDRYRVYWDLREKGYKVTPGIKYGCDFAVYEHGPGLDHAPFIVQVRKTSELLTAQEVVESGRLASTVRKTFTIAVVSEGKISYLSFKWWRP